MNLILGRFLVVFVEHFFSRFARRRSSIPTSQSLRSRSSSSLYDEVEVRFFSFQVVLVFIWLVFTFLHLTRRGLTPRDPRTLSTMK